MIIHNESTLSTNNSCQKFWTFEGYEIFRPKRKRKDIIISDFLFP